MKIQLDDPFIFIRNFNIMSGFYLQESLLQVYKRERI